MTEKRIYKDEADADHSSIHLMVNSRCTNRCPDCCNLQYDLASVPVITAEELKSAKEVTLTGGEPFLMKDIYGFCVSLRKQYPNIERLYIYTSGTAMFQRVRNWARMGAATLYIDGINFSPKCRMDEYCINQLFKDDFYRRLLGYMKSHRIILMPHPDRTTDDDEFIRSLGLTDFTEVRDYTKEIRIEKRDFQEEFQPNGGIWRRLPIFMDENY